jgi:uncharacterized protein
MKALKIQLCLLVAVWGVWFLGVGINGLTIIKNHFVIAATMLLGSFVAGSTSVGGGAVAFPVFTKFLHIDSTTALIFALAIQSIGMTSASIIIVLTKTPICTRIIKYSIVAGGLGFFVSFFGIRTHISSIDIRYLFSCFSFLVAAALLWIHFQRGKIPHEQPRNNKLGLFICCVCGGILSGIIGSGIDFILFSFMIFIWHYDIKKAIATSVIIMASNSITGFITILLFTDLFKGELVNYWLAAIPIVVVGAPLGALACRYWPKKIILTFLLILIFIDIS